MQRPPTREAFFFQLRRILLRHADRLWHAIARRRRSRKVVMVVQLAIHDPAQLSGFRTKRRTSPAQEHYDNDLASIGIRVGSEPAEAGTVFGAGSGLAEDFLFADAQTHTARRAVANGSGHAVEDFRNLVADIEMPLHHRLEVR